jgi:transposase
MGAELSNLGGHDAQPKAQILAECELPGASVAKVEISLGINDNVVHCGRQLALEATPKALCGLRSRGTAFGRGHVDLRRGTTTVFIAWPGGAALGELAARHPRDAALIGRHGLTRRGDWIRTDI